MEILVTRNGRPPKDNAKDHPVRTRLNKQDYQELVKLAELDGFTLAGKVRDCIKKVIRGAKNNDYKGKQS